jgi:hypothetical protein
VNSKTNSPHHEKVKNGGAGLFVCQRRPENVFGAAI